VTKFTQTLTMFFHSFPWLVNKNLVFLVLLKHMTRNVDAFGNSVKMSVNQDFAAQLLSTSFVNRSRMRRCGIELLRKVLQVIESLLENVSDQENFTEICVFELKVHQRLHHAESHKLFVLFAVGRNIPLVNDEILASANFFFDASDEKLNYTEHVNKCSTFLDKLAIRQMLKLVVSIDDRTWWRNST
jgi:hypothetical protein